jgi:hypothetical protein
MKDLGKSAITRDEHLHEMLFVVIESLEVIHNRHAGHLTLESIKILLEASRKMDDENESEEPFFDDIGGEEIYRDLAREIKEWIFIYESADVRAIKGRPYDKLSEELDYLFLAEIYEVVVDALRHTFTGMKRILPSLQIEHTSLEVFREYLKSGNVEDPMINTDVLLARFKPMFRSFEREEKKNYEILSSTQVRIKRIDIDKINDYGVVGIREEWRGNQLFIDRLHFEYLGKHKKEALIFRKSFLDKIRRSDSHNKGDKYLFYYVKCINDFLCKIASSNDHGGVTEMQIALDAYLAAKYRFEEELLNSKMKKDIL